MTVIDNKLKESLRDRYITGNIQEVSKFFRKQVMRANLTVAYPETHEEVHNIVRNANESGTSIFTSYDKYLPGEIADRAGIIVDFKEMKKIERLDKNNLMAHVQCGITFDELKSELQKHGLKIQMPAGVTNTSVVKNFVNRSVIKASAKYPEAQVTNMYVTLADGSLHKSGSHALDETACDSPDGAAFLSCWYLGARDIYGVVSRGSIVLYPIWEKRDAIAFDFKDQGGLLRAMRDIPRREIGIEFIGMDSVYFKKLTGQNGGDWVLVVGFDGFTEHVDWQEKTVRKFADEMGGKENVKMSEVILEMIDDAWPVMAPYHTSFMTLFSRVEEFDELIRKEWARGRRDILEIGRLYTAMDRGRSVSCLYEFYDDSDDTGRFVDELNLKLLRQGAYFDTPGGDLSKAVFDVIEGYGAQLRRIKDMMDPKGILNPGILKF